MNVAFLFYANIAVWSAVALYLLVLARRQASLGRRIEQLELSNGETDNG